MKKTLIVAAMMALVATGASAKTAKDSAAIAKNKPVFTVVKQNPITRDVPLTWNEIFEAKLYLSKVFIHFATSTEK